MLPRCATVEKTCRSRNLSRRPIWLSQSILLGISKTPNTFEKKREFSEYQHVTSLAIEPVINRNAFLGDSVMMLPRRRFLGLAASAVALPAVSRLAWAQTYPTRPVRILVASPPGGTADFLARLMGRWLSDRLGQPFIVENRSGAATNVAAESVANAAPDGHLLLLVNPAHALNATLYDRLNYNFLRDIAPVAGLLRAPNVMEVHPSVPARTVPEFIAHAKANPGKISYASAGTGTLLHLAGELFKMMAGVEMVHVPYRGTAPALTDLLGGQVQMMCDNISTSIEHLKAGKLRALAVTTATRSPLLPDLPTVGDFLPGFEQSAFFGIGAPRHTPAEIIDRLNKEVNAGLADPSMKARLAEAAGPVLPGSPEDFGRLIAAETEKWGRVIRLTGIKPT
jgi:tripartite-type tricarboxylate transporter receptor subunit TctC